jgi:hypothetical protein
MRDNGGVFRGDGAGVNRKGKGECQCHSCVGKDLDSAVMTMCAESRLVMDHS